MVQENFVGVDCHKNTIACYQQGQFKEFKTTLKGYQKALKWAGKEKPWAIEGAYSYGLPFSVYLLENGCKVYEINPLLTSNLRKTLSLCGEKNDYGDAKVISMFAEKTKLSKVSVQTIKVKEKLTARKLAIKQRTEIINHIKNLYCRRGEELPFKVLTTLKAQKWLQNQQDTIIQSFGKTLFELTNLIKTLEKEIEEIMPEKAIKLTALTGIKPIRASIIYTETKGKCSTKSQLANYAGIAPVQNSSGQKQKHRNNKRGNRQLNSVFYQLSLCQSRFDEKGKEYFERKLSEGKTKRHARKCLARQLVNQVWQILNT